ncbi:hypothetical protein BGZ93_004284 [Podila epicladia]|nr:hypothetical protein BGZ93_004284 [Podila epicladia]
MNALTSSSARMIRAPVQAAVRQFSVTPNAGTGHTTKRLVGASAVSFAVGIDVTIAYFYFKNKMYKVQER